MTMDGFLNGVVLHVAGFAAIGVAAGRLYVRYRRWSWLLAAALALLLLALPWPLLAAAPLLAHAAMHLLARVGVRKDTGQVQVQTRPGLPTDAPTASPTADRAPPPRPLKTVLEELDQMIGLAPVKHQVATIAARLRVDRERQAAGFSSREPLPLAFVMRGNPGTGKTSVARLLAEILAGLGALPSARLVECGRENLVGQYVGETEQKTAVILERAEGGTLFIDEAYALVGTRTESDFGPLAVNVLLRALENRRGRLAIIVAGYPAEMDRFLSLDSGLRQRFNVFIDFPDYGPPELAQIFHGLARAEGFALSPEADTHLRAFCLELGMHRGPDFANARLIRSTFNAARDAHALRSSRLGPKDAMRDLGRLEREDLVHAARRVRSSLSGGPQFHPAPARTQST